jgi:hypothetical protein
MTISPKQKNWDWFESLPPDQRRLVNEFGMGQVKSVRSAAHHNSHVRTETFEKVLTAARERRLSNAEILQFALTWRP